eukprot:gb/GEZN01004520.1/.p1 GENE.gb/GEZN01004520.1/~~gb/GEZN01004520.1/.p1  ORF type:complete len:510 (-),score=57.78 gb/GEZN01004520.1/:274-1803(-)
MADVDSLLAVLGDQSNVSASAIPAVRDWARQQNSGFSPARLSRRELTYFAQIMMLGADSKTLSSNTLLTTKALQWMKGEGFVEAVAIQLGQRLLDEGLITKLKPKRPRFEDMSKNDALVFSREVREFRLDSQSLAVETLQTVYSMGRHVTSQLRVLEAGQRKVGASIHTMVLLVLVGSYVLILLHAHYPFLYHPVVGAMVVVLLFLRPNFVSLKANISLDSHDYDSQDEGNNNSSKANMAGLSSVALPVEDSEIQTVRAYLAAKYPQVHHHFRDGYLRVVLEQPQSRGDDKVRRTVDYSLEKLDKCLQLHTQHKTFAMNSSDSKFVTWFACGDNYVRGFTQWPSCNVPILWMHKTKAWTRQNPDVDFIARLFLSSQIASNLPQGVESWVTVVHVDPNSRGFGNLVPRALAMKMLHLGSTAFPDRVKIMIVGPVDSGMMFMWKLMKPLMPRNMKRKMVLTQSLSKTLLEMGVCSSDSLPSFLGGPAEHPRGVQSFEEMLTEFKAEIKKME